ncbi:MAG: choice-of-anchor J domain-containing protein, partial [Bacteroidales bacterium]|nr:choice-of-anchor J domain-containing protein [Bacteroidales bacterium]
MKRLLFFLMAMIIAIQGWSQISTFPWTEGFETGLTNWTQQHVVGSVNWSTATSQSQISAAQEGTHFAYFAAASYDGYTTKLISPIFDLSALTNPTLTFYYIQPTWGGDQNTLKVYYRADTTSAWTQLFYFPNSITSWTMESITLPNSSSTYQIAFEAEDNYGYSNGLDNISIVNLTCPRPTALSATNPTTTGVDLGWTDATGTIWNIQYMLANETDWTNSTTISGVTNPYTFTTLSPSTAYKTRVQTDCGTEQSEWSSVITFATGCDVITTIPWTEGFETASWSPAIFPGNALAPLCWTNVNKGSGSTNIWSRGTTAHTGTGAAQMYTDNSSQNNDWLISPKITLTGNERLRFWAMNYSSTSTEVDEISIWISDGIITSIDTTNMGVYDSIQGFIQIYQTGIPVGDWQQYELNLNQYSGDRYIAFVRRNTPNNGWYLRLDDIEISELPTCMRPTNAVVSNVTTTDAEISWVNGSLSDASWWIYYKQSSASTYDSVLVNSNPYTLTTLLPSSGYSIYVVTDCGTEFSEASNVVNFQTLCAAIDGLTNLPWNEGFEGITANNQLPACWSSTNLGNYTYTQIANYNSFNRNARTGTKSAYFRYGCNDKFVTPIFNLYAGQSYDFSFWYVTDEYSGWQNLKAGVRAVGSSTTTQTIGTPLSNITNSTYELYLGMFTPSADGLYEFTIECQADGVPY